MTRFVRAAQSGFDSAHAQFSSKISGVRFLSALFHRIPCIKRADFNLFVGVVKSFDPQLMTHSLNWTTSRDWYTSFGFTRELSESLHLELQIGNDESLRKRYCIGRDVRFFLPRRRIALFYFALAKLPNVDSRRDFVVNRFCRLVTQAGYALLVCLVNANFVDANTQNEVRER